MWLCQTLTMNETLKWLSSLPILMQESFWWWQCSDRYIISLFHHLQSFVPNMSTRHPRTWSPTSPHLQSPVPNKPHGFCGRKAPWKKEEGSPGRPHLDFHTAPDLWRQDRRKHGLTAADKGRESIRALYVRMYVRWGYAEFRSWVTVRVEVAVLGCLC